METARFWASRCEYITEKDRYEIRKVTGPDEWHEPVDNNVYTNYLAKSEFRICNSSDPRFKRASQRRL